MDGEERIFKDWEFLKVGDSLYHPPAHYLEVCIKFRPCNSLGDVGIGYASFFSVALLVRLAFAEPQALVH